MNPLFVIVHEVCVNSYCVTKEIERIKREEDFITITGHTGSIPDNVPKQREVKVCGAYGEICVWAVCDAFKRRGYNTEIFSPATEYVEEKPIE